MRDVSTQGRVFYGWVIVAIATFALVVSNGLSIGGIPVFYKSIREDFVAGGTVAADRAESFIAFGASLTFLFSGLISPFAGWFIQKFPLKRVMLVGCAMLGSGLILHAVASTPTLVYAARIIMGLSLGFVGVLPSVVLVSHWFVRRRGTALGLLLTGTSLGGVLVPPIATPLIEQFRMADGDDADQPSDLACAGTGDRDPGSIATVRSRYRSRRRAPANRCRGTAIARRRIHLRTSSPDPAVLDLRTGSSFDLLSDLCHESAT